MSAIQKLILILSLFSVGFIGCSQELTDDEEGDITSVIITGVSEANSKLTATADMISSSAGSSSVGTLSTNLDSVWNTANGVGALSNTGQETLKEWIGNMFDPTFVNTNDAKVTFAGRITNALDVLCILGAAGLTTDSTGLPEDGNHTFTITAAMLTACGNSETSMIDAEISLTATTLTNTAIYDKSFSVDLPGAANDACPFVFQVKANSSVVNIATAEDQNCDGRDQASASVIRYDITNQTMRFRYISQAFGADPSGFEFYRGYLNEASDEAYVLGFYGGDSNPAAGSSANLDGYIGFSAAGRPSAGGTVAVSAAVDNQPGIADDVYNGCVDSSNGNVTSTTDTLNCTLGGGADMTGSFSEITDAYDANNARSDIYDIDATTDVDFTDDTDMF